MSQIGEYEQLTSFTNESAGTAEWCIAQKNGKQFFVKKFQSPVYPSKDLGLPEKKYNARVAKFHAAIESRKNMYHQLRENDKYGLFIIPVEVISYQYHICTIADYIIGNVRPDEICTLSEWQRIVLMRTLTLALMSVHNAGVIHSDMKPENVMIYQNELNGSCALKLIDFDGSFYESDPPEDISGDPTYFAPEAYAKQTMPAIRLDHRIDIFALGIILHYFWTGKLPYKDPEMTIGQAALKGEMIWMDPSVPVSLQEIIRQALAGNPDNRKTKNLRRRKKQLPRNERFLRNVLLRHQKNRSLRGPFQFRSYAPTSVDPRYLVTKLKWNAAKANLCMHPRYRVIML